MPIYLLRRGTAHRSRVLKDKNQNPTKQQQGPNLKKEKKKADFSEVCVEG